MMAPLFVAEQFTAALYALLDETFDTSHDYFLVWREIGALTPAEWGDIQNELRASHKRIKTLITEIPGWESEMNIGDAIAVTTYTAYHLGELRQALCTLKP
jgi:hypothetical protein